VDIGVLERDLVGFQRVQDRILPKYLTGDAQIDAITLLQVYAEQPYL
jgi:hypothetical protein